MIDVVAGQPFTATLEGAPPNGHALGVRIIDPAMATILVARSTEGIAEFPAGSGIYSTQLVAPTKDAIGRSLPAYLEVVWDDTVVFTAEPITVRAGALPVDQTDRPTVDDVAMRLRTRTVGDGDEDGGLGSDTGPADVTTFTETTRPKASEVEAVIDTAYGAVWTRVEGPHDQVPDTQIGSLKLAVELYAAILIETSFFRDTYNPDLVALWRDMATESINGVNAVIVGSPKRLSFGSLRIGTDRSAPAPNFDPIPGIDFLPSPAGTVPEGSN